MKTIEIIAKLHPCAQGAAYLRKYKNLKTAWKHCPRGDWMLWLAQKIGVSTPVLTLAKGLCANTVRYLMQDPRSIAAVDAALSFGRGEITEKVLADAAHAADAATYAADYAAYAADYAAHAAATAAATADADAADADADAAAYAAAADAVAAGAAAAKKANQQQTADICREILTKAVMDAAERGE